MRFARLSSDDAGASALEYALLAALIGLGVVGSLVTTKTSLNAVFGTASSQIGGAASVAVSAPAPSRAGYWQSKTLSSQMTAPVDSGKVGRTQYNYADGTTVEVATRQDMDVRSVSIVDPVNKERVYITFINGKISSYTLRSYASDMTTNQGSRSTPGDGIQNGVIVKMMSDTYSNGNFVSTATTSPSEEFINRASSSSEDYSYFNTLTPRP